MAPCELFPPWARHSARSASGDTYVCRALSAISAPRSTACAERGRGKCAATCDRRGRAPGRWPRAASCQSRRTAPWPAAPGTAIRTCCAGWSRARTPWRCRHAPLPAAAAPRSRPSLSPCNRQPGAARCAAPSRGCSALRRCLRTPEAGHLSPKSRFALPEGRRASGGQASPAQPQSFAQAGCCWWHALADRGWRLG